MTYIIRNTIGLLMFLLSSIIIAEDCSNIDLIVTSKDGSTETQSFNKSKKSIKFYKTYVSNIEGLEKFDEIEELVFSYTAFLNDFSFLEGLKNVKVLVFDTVSIANMDFVKSMESLEGLIIQGSKIDFELLELNNQMLEYIEITNSNIEEMPVIRNIPGSLKVINLAYNKILTLDANLIDQNSNVKFILSGNPVHIDSENVVIDQNFYDIIPDKYLKYMK